MQFASETSQKLHQGELLTDPNLDRPINFPNTMACFKLHFSQHFSHPTLHFFMNLLETKVENSNKVLVISQAATLPITSIRSESPPPFDKREASKINRIF